MTATIAQEAAEHGALMYSFISRSPTQATRTALASLAVVGAAVATEGFVLEPRRVVVTHHTVALHHLPAELDGFTIAHLSDLHVGARYWRPQALARAVEQVNRLRPDLIAITGDFADSATGPIVCADYLRQLQAPCGTFAVLGNHDYYGSKRRPGLVARALQDIGIHVLLNTACSIERDGARLWLVGVEDGRLGRANVETALLAAPPDSGPRILLSHYPDIVNTLHPGQIDLVLSGHTHGGQVNVPVLARMAVRYQARSRFIAGRYDVHGTPLLVSRGIATIGIPLRLFCPPEVLAIRLVAAHPPRGSH